MIIVSEKKPKTSAEVTSLMTHRFVQINKCEFPDIVGTGTIFEKCRLTYNTFGCLNTMRGQHSEVNCARNRERQKTKQFPVFLFLVFVSRPSFGNL